MPKTASATPRKKSAPLRVTYATMFDPPETLHVRFERALARARGSLGREYGMLIGGREVVCPDRFESRSPIDTDWRLGVFPAGGRVEAEAALAAAHAARPQWASRPWRARVRVLRRVAATIERRVYDIAAALALEVGKTGWKRWGTPRKPPT